MKKIKLTAILLTVLMLMLAGCNSAASKNTVTSAFDFDTTNIAKPEIDLSNAEGVLKDVLDKGVLVVATAPDNPPYEYVADDGKTLSGSELFLAKYIADILGVKLQIETMDFGAVLTAVDTGKADLAMAGFGWKKDRAENFELSIGYHSSTAGSSCHCLMVRTEDLEKYDSFEDFDGQMVAAQAGSLHQMYVEDQMPNAVLELVSGFDQAILNLSTKKVEALATSCSVARQYAEQSGGTLSKSPLEFDLSMYGAYEGTVVGAKKGETSIIDVMNQILTFVNENAIYDGMYQQALDETGMIDGEE